MSRRFWGYTAIFVGLLALLERIDYLPPIIFRALSGYWPVLLIILGVLLLFKVPRGVLIGVSLVVVALALTGAEGVSLGLGGHIGSSSSSAQLYKAPLDGVEALEVELLVGASQVMVGSTSAALYEGELEGSGFKSPQHNFNLIDGIGHLKISQGEKILTTSAHSRWRLDLSSVIPVRLGIMGGAGELDLDLRNLRLEELEIAGGAARVEARFGQRLPAVKVVIKMGAADMRLEFPRAARVELEVSSPLIKRDLDDADQWIKEGSTLVYPGSGQGPVYQVEIQGAAAHLGVALS